MTDVMSLPPKSVNSLGTAEMKCRRISRDTSDVCTTEAAASKTFSDTGQEELRFHLIITQFNS